MRPRFVFSPYCILRKDCALCRAVGPVGEAWRRARQGVYVLPGGGGDVNFECPFGAPWGTSSPAPWAKLHDRATPDVPIAALSAAVHNPRLSAVVQATSAVRPREAVGENESAGGHKIIVPGIEVPPVAGGCGSCGAAAKRVIDEAMRDG